MFKKLKDLLTLAAFTYALTQAGRGFLSIGRAIVDARKQRTALPHN